MSQLLKSYESYSDYKKAFALSAFNMYSKTDINRNNCELTEYDFLEASDEELGNIVSLIINNGGNIRKEFDEIECDNIYERFYNAHNESLRSALKPLADSFINFNKAYSPNFSGIYALLEQQKTVLKNIPIPNFEAIGSVVSALQFQATNVAEQFSRIKFNYVLDIPKFDFPGIKVLLDSIPKVTLI